MIKIDGSYLEGGGQIVRTAVGLAVLFKKPVYIYNIRKNRNPPGLKNQHFAAIKFLEKISLANSKGIEVGSKEIYFEPKVINGGEYKVDIKTAGSISLFLQATILPLLFANKKLILQVKGGTDVKNSPSIDYFRFVIAFYLKRFAEKLEINVVRRGFYPKGGGIVSIVIKPKFKRDKYKNINDFLIDLRRNINKYNYYDYSDFNIFYIYSIASEDLKRRKVAERMLNSAKLELKNTLGNDIDIIENVEYVKSLSTGAVITIVAYNGKNVIGSDSLGEIGKRAEEVGKEAASKIISEVKNKAMIDKHLADNLIPYLALVGGKIKTSEFTNHLLTNIWVVEKFFGKIFKLDSIHRVIEAQY